MNPIRLAITLGDPSGIGPEVTIKALETLATETKIMPILIGQRRSLNDTLKKWGQAFQWQSDHEWHINNIIGQFADIAPDIEAPILLGMVSHQAGMIAARSLQYAVHMCQQNMADAIVTAPIHKKAFHLAGFHYPGQTEFLAELTHTPKVAMMIAGQRIRVVLVTTHISLATVAQSLNSTVIFEKIELTYVALKHNFGLANPCIAVAALNPHAGDQGCFGHEEEEIIAPAITAARQQGINAIGPLPADSLFPQAAQGKYDAVVVMYHDQGLIPVKLESFGCAVNVTLGLPFGRTSPDHGTAHDIAGKGLASEGSMVAAIKMAITLNSRPQNDRNVGVVAF